jgi:2'-5' RNA ligase
VVSVEIVRAFLALEIPDEIKEKIMEVEASVGRSGADVKLVEKENLHVTMKFLGDVAPDTIEKVVGVMESVKESRFPMEVRGTGVFPNPRIPRVVWVGVGKGGDRVVAVFRHLDTEIAKLGFRTERDFTPHITIGRVRSPAGRDELLRALDGFKEKPFGATVVDRIVLKRSQLTSSGPIYSSIREVELPP